MADVIDILRDTNGYIVKNGDFVKGDATLKHQRDLLMSEKGEWRQKPSAGVGINKFVLDNSSADDFRGEVQSEFENDGMKISEFNIKGLSDIQIVAAYE
jgi:hypothetical protein